MTNLHFDALREYLKGIPTGAIPSTNEVSTLLARCWDALKITNRQGMRPDKLHRMEEVDWDPPRLSFLIERHGGTVRGSVNAEVQGWIIDVEQQIGSCTDSGTRLVGERKARLNFAPLVEQVVLIIEDRKEDSRLQWLSDSRVRVGIGAIIPSDSGAQQTVAGRRRRFGKLLEQALQHQGWQLVSGTSAHTYQRVIG